MSGFEIVGVVLGAFPLVFLAIDGCRKAAEKMDMLHYYKTHLDSFKRDMNRTYQEFRYILEDLLAPVTDPEKIEMLLDNPEAPDWKTLGDGVRQRLPGSYETYMSTIEDYYLEMKQIEKLLRNSKPDVTYHSSNSKVSPIRRNPMYGCLLLIERTEPKRRQEPCW